MNKIHRKVEYALIAIKHMRTKSPGERTTAKEICTAYMTPFDATSRVLQQLSQNGFLKSEQGAMGGYILIQDLQRWTFYDLMKSILGPAEIAKCLQDSCELRDSCNIVSPMQILNRRLIEFYPSITVASLVEPRAQRKQGQLEL